MILRLFYTLLLILVSPFFLYGLFKKKPGKPSVGKRWKEHFGFTPKCEGSSPLWLHAVSVGEVIAATPVIRAIKAKAPNQPIVVTTTTPTGAEQVSKLGDLVEHRYMPLDFGFAVQGFLKAVKPSQLLIMETELWPNTLHTVAKAGLPVTIINARLSERACQRYSKVQPVFNMLSRNLTHILCQHEDDAQRFIRLGLPEHKVTTTGSVKYDIDVSEPTKQAGKELRQLLGSERPVWIAASTHKGEDEQVLDAHKKLLEQFPSCLLILVPRHPERFSSVADLSRSSGFNTVTRTSQEAVSGSTQVYLADTMGEMMTLLGAADICFMGGSLVGSKVGGHNLLEPSALGLPTLTGPSYFNFTDITDQLIKAGATQVVTDSCELCNALSERFLNFLQVKCAGVMATKTVERNRGAISATIAHIKLA